MSTDKRSRWMVVIVLVLLSLLAITCVGGGGDGGGGGSNSSSSSSSSSAQPACSSETSTKQQGCDQFKVLRTVVNKNNSPQTNTSTWRPVSAGDTLGTNSAGEAELNFSSCYPLPLYLFTNSNSRIQVSECRKNTTQSTACLDYGTVYSSCPGEFTISTNNAYITKRGTVYSVTYLPERDVTLVIVFDGEAVVLPVRSYDPVAYGTEIDVPVGAFTFVSRDPVGDLAPSTVYPLEELPKIVPELGILDWMIELGIKAQQDDILPPSWPSDWTLPSGTFSDNCRDEEVFCVGLVTEVGPVFDNSFNQAAWEGIQQAQRDFGAQTTFIESASRADFDSNVISLADQGYDVVVTVGFNVAETTTKLAFGYPDTRFIGVDQVHQAFAPNLVSINFAEDQSGFLAGTLAAMMSRTGRVAAVCGTDDVPAVWRYGEGFRAGVFYTDLGVDPIIIYHNDVGVARSFTDPDWGARIAESLVDEGVDVIFGCGGQTGDAALLTAARRGIYVIGVDVDQYFTLPEAAPRMLSSAMKMFTQPVYEIIRLAWLGDFPSGSYDGPPGYAPFHDLDGEVSADIRARLEDYRIWVTNGQIQTNVPESKP